ncbi:FYVE-domain-containing protein [Rhizophagus irregularis]|uniref:FYVE-domain-containing protein n=1 Tax=Rhizophagus irregularis TaxID=588596 RepID=A0A2N1MTN4_9GLOM|nr:FYVE-domain-containing protein [Rhizophagus irregularis]
MNLSISPLTPFHPTSSRQRRRSNSSSNILASTVNVKAVRSPRRNENLDDTYNNSNEEYFEDNKLASSNRTIPRPPRLAFDTQHNLRIPMTPPSRQEYKAHHQNHSHMLLSSYNNNINNSHHDYYHHNFSNGLSGKESRTTSFSSTKSNKSTQSMNKSLTAFYNERIEKRTSMAFDDEEDDDICSDSDSDTTLSVSSSTCGDDVRDNRRNNRNNQLAKQVSLLRKEIDVVKSSLEGLQKDHKEMLNEKKQLEQQYQETRYEVTKTLECSTNDLMEYNELLNAKMETLSLEMGTRDNSDFSHFSEDISIINNCNVEWPIEYTNIMNNCVQQAKELEYFQVELEKSKQDFRLLLSFKEEIERTLEEKEREYLEKLRECEAVANYQVGTIDSMEKLLKELEIKMDKLQNEQRQERTGKHKHSSSHLSASSILSNGEKLKKKHAQKSSVDIKNVSLQNNSSNDNSTASVEDLIPSYCLSPPQTRRQSCTNPITLFTDEERIRHQTRFCLASRWVEDDEVSICQQAGCSVKFNLWNRRHHCRRCGNIFCSTHSAYSMLLFPDGIEDWGGVWSRVCESCFKDSK